MSTIVEASVPAAQFALKETIQRVPDATFEAVRIVVGGTDDVIPLVWGVGDDPAAVTRALESDPSVDSVRPVTRLHEATLYQLEWTTRVRIATHLLATRQGAIVSARASDDTWTFRLLFPEREAVAAIVEDCDTYGVDLRIERICPMTESSPLGRSDLTDAQRQTIEAALECGYYDVPRQTTLTELSADLDISHQALSERLRRGHRRLIESALSRRPPLESRP